MIDRLRHWLHRRRHPARYAQLEPLLRTQALHRDELLSKQQRDLADIVAFAATHTPYYAETLTPCLGGDIDLNALPILHKDDVTRRMDDLLANTADRTQVKIGHTGGSTGKPLAFWYDDTKHELMRAGMMRSYMLSGWRPGQKILNFWGARLDVLPGGVFGTQFGDAVAAEHTIAAYEYTEAQLVEWANFIQSYRPVLLQGYASVLSEVARVVIDNRLPMPRSLLGAYSTAEVLTDSQRKRMEQAFGCKVFNQYGSREIPNIACECRLGNMHIFTDMVMLESVSQENESGEPEDRLLVTSLTNRLMPMIRYDIGDAGRLLDGECACGLAFPLMEMGLCRQNDLIRTRSGKTVHPSFFNRLLYGQTQIRQYQWVQRDLDHITLILVASRPLKAETLASLEANIRRDVDAQMVLEVNLLDDIPCTVSGKHRFVIGMEQGSRRAGNNDASG
ncbi:MAG: phenylacetate--CoA ligase family protein [Thiobacillus sp.]